jgi:hypothetical protein
VVGQGRCGGAANTRRSLHKQLTALDLSYTVVSDAGLKELQGLQQLTTLNLYLTAVTDAGLKELQKALPGCRIIH